MDTFLNQFGDVAADLAWLLGGGAVPWLVLLAVLLVRPPALSGLRALIGASQEGREDYALSMVEFRSELFERENRLRQAQSVRVSRDPFADAPWVAPLNTSHDGSWNDAPSNGERA